MYFGQISEWQKVERGVQKASIEDSGLRYPGSLHKNGSWLRAWYGIGQVSWPLKWCSARKSDGRARMFTSWLNFYKSISSFLYKIHLIHRSSLWPFRGYWVSVETNTERRSNDVSRWGASTSRSMTRMTLFKKLPGLGTRSWKKELAKPAHFFGQIRREDPTYDVALGDYASGERVARE